MILSVFVCSVFFFFVGQSPWNNSNPDVPLGISLQGSGPCGPAVGGSRQKSGSGSGSGRDIEVLMKWVRGIGMVIRIRINLCFFVFVYFVGLCLLILKRTFGTVLDLFVFIGYFAEILNKQIPGIRGMLLAKQITCFIQLVVVLPCKERAKHWKPLTVF